MEEIIKSISDYVLALIVERWIELALFGGAVILWRWWMGYQIRDRISALEARPAITQTFNFNSGADAHDHDRQLQNAIEDKMVHGLKETINRLPQHPLGDGHSYAELPDGTRIVTMADGSIRLALPARLRGMDVTTAVGMSASLTVDDDPYEAFRKAEERWLHQPKVGREAARLIMMAPTFQEAEAVHDNFRLTEPRLDASWAHYAFLYRMEMEGRSDEVIAVSAEIAEELGDDFIVDNEDDYWKELQSLYIKTRRT
ncbi:MAG: hypothetical protein OXC14_05750 [Rhodospirillaceae bacterium]|nr:hypothetical protein [Rhodospirillaceae bacterium]